MDVQNNNFIYYDALISNYNSPNSSIPLNFTDTRSSPLIKDTTGYTMSIVRFTLDTNSLPVFIPIMQPNSSTETVYSITLSYNDISYQQFMEFIPQNISTTNSPSYFHIYTYTYLCYLINNTFQQCYENLVNKCSNQGVVLDDTISIPNISFNTTTQLFSITIDNDYYGTDNNLINIYFNNSMQNLFLFNAIFDSLTNTNGLNYLLFNTGNTIIQETSTIGNLSPIMSIVFTSNQLPIIQNISGNPNIYVNGQIPNQNSSNVGYNIITDLVSNSFQYLSNIVYVPSGQYRYISLNPNSKIQNIDFSVYFLNKQGDLIQIYLNTGCSCSVKFLFEKI
jgi:hypothetical protein